MYTVTRKLYCYFTCNEPQISQTTHWFYWTAQLYVWLSKQSDADTNPDNWLVEYTIEPVSVETDTEIPSETSILGTKS